jgi:hypothetical protein
LLLALARQEAALALAPEQEPEQVLAQEQELREALGPVLSGRML